MYLVRSAPSNVIEVSSAFIFAIAAFEVVGLLAVTSSKLTLISEPYTGGTPLGIEKPEFVPDVPEVVPAEEVVPELVPAGAVDNESSEPAMLNSWKLLNSIRPISTRTRISEVFGENAPLLAGVSLLVFLLSDPINITIKLYILCKAKVL
jgi:hypothetical protein